MQILVTGGAGFIASHIVDAYIADGHDVTVIDDLSRGSLTNVNPQAKLRRGDIRRRDFVESVFNEVKPQAVNHHAAQMDVRRGVREPIFDAEVNILGSLNIIEASVAHKVRKVIYISTAGAAYGEPKELPVSENCPIDPITPYGISKHTVEHYLYTFSFLYGLPYVVLRYGNVYGPRQSSQGEAGVFAIFAEQLLGGVQPVIYGDGHKIRDYVYIADVVRANVLALGRGDGEIFNIASGIGTTDFEVFSLVRSLLGKTHVEPRYVSKRPGEIDKICMDVSKARHILGWQPGVSLQEGASETVHYFQERHKSGNIKNAAAPSGATSN